MRKKYQGIGLDFVKEGIAGRDAKEKRSKLLLRIRRSFRPNFNRQRWKENSVKKYKKYTKNIH